MIETKIPISIKCPHCGKEVIKIEIPIPIDKIMEFLKGKM